MFRGLQAALRMLPVAAHAAPSPAEEPPDERTALHQTSPAHLLTVSEVFKTFPKVTSINTPDINSKLAIPFKKELVGTREPFKEIYSATRANIKSVSGKLTNYQEEKERRRSLPFYWPESDERAAAGTRRRTFSSSGRQVGSSSYFEYEAENINPTDKTAPSSPDYELLISELSEKLKQANLQVFEKSEEVKQLKSDNESKDEQLLGYQVVIDDLEKQVMLGPVDAHAELDVQRNCASAGRLLKPWSELSLKQKGRETKPIMASLAKLAERRSTDPSQIAGYLVYRTAYQDSKALAEVGRKIEEGVNIGPRKVVSPDQALWMSYPLGSGLGKLQYRKLKTFSAKNDICSLPAWPHLSDHIHQHILPSINVITEGDRYDKKVIGVYHHPVQLLKKHLVRFLERRVLEEKPLPPGDYEVVCKTGDDGSRHNWYRWALGPLPEGVKTTQPISIVDLMILKITNMAGTEEFLWREKCPCSERATRVLAIMMAEEKRSVLTKCLLWMQEVEEEAKETGIHIQFNDEDYFFIPDFIDRNDKKLARILSGIGDGCDWCLTSPDLWTDMSLIQEGFPMDRSLEDMKKTWQMLKKTKKGEVVKTTGDFDPRQGLCHEPLTLRPLFNYTVCHKPAKALNHKIKILMHLINEHHLWREDKIMKEKLKTTKKLVQTTLKPGQVVGGSAEDNIGVAWEFPDAKGLGGTTTTSELARKVFGSTVLRSRLVKLCPQVYQPAFAQLLFNDLILLRLINCDLPVLTERIDLLCKEQMRICVEEFDGQWVQFPTTIHEMYAHTADIMEDLNDSRGLKNYSEENLEKLHKIIRRTRETKARLTCAKDNLTDVLTRQNVCSDPVVQFYEPRINCQVCLAEGHTQISCPYAESKVASDMPYADVVFYSYVHPDNRPDCLK